MLDGLWNHPETVFVVMSWQAAHRKLRVVLQGRLSNQLPLCPFATAGQNESSGTYVLMPFLTAANTGIRRKPLPQDYG